MRSHRPIFSALWYPGDLAVAVLVPTPSSSMWTANSRRAAALCAVVFLFAVIRPSSIARVIQAKVEPNHTAFPLDRESPVNISQIQPQLAFVDADGLTFLEMNHYGNPQFLLAFTILDPKAAYRYAHANGFNGMAFLKTKFPIPANVEPYDAFIKGSTVGLTLVKERSALRAAIVEARNYDDEVMIEQFIAGRELTVGILGDRALPVGEIIP